MINNVINIIIIAETNLPFQQRFKKMKGKDKDNSKKRPQGPAYLSCYSPTCLWVPIPLENFIQKTGPDQKLN